VLLDTPPWVDWVVPDFELELEDEDCDEDCDEE
jgi:hypothetical protein